MAVIHDRVGFELGMGWLPDYPDFRDYDIDKNVVEEKQAKRGVEESVNGMLMRMNYQKATKVSLPSSRDLRAWCSPIENQGSLGSCTANAGVGLLEYFERRAFGKHIDASRLFLYKTTRNLLHWTGDRGAFIRTTMGAMVLFGICPEEYWEYKITDFDDEPPAFCYSFAENYKTIQYYRLDSPGTSKSLLLSRIKYFTAAGIPSMFGFSVFNSINQASSTGKIPYPCSKDRLLGGHAVMVVGFDDEKKIKNRLCDKETEGALLIRNSWGKGWGEDGYGWLPYEYLLKGLAVDWWSLIKNEWVDTDIFKFE